MKKVVLLFVLVFTLVGIFSACNNNVNTGSNENSNIRRVVETNIILPESFKEMYKNSSVIVTIKVDKTESRFAQFNKDEIDKLIESIYISTATVAEVIKGNVKIGDKIKIMQFGDSINTIFTREIEGGGYLHEKSTYLLFLDQISNGYKTKLKKGYNEEFDYTISPIVGQYKINSKGDILSIAEPSKSLVGDITSVQNMKALISEVKTVENQKVLDNVKKAFNDNNLVLNDSGIFIPSVLENSKKTNLKISKKESGYILEETLTDHDLYMTYLVNYKFISIKVGT